MVDDMALVDWIVGVMESITSDSTPSPLMMSLVTGRERNEKEWAKLFDDAGYTDYKITPILGFRFVIEVYP
ncbi:putative O-methyltransferase COMT-type, S-adenosyl-L-methionine-dependent methyltransferase [Helianthus annuus]|nr:putative O-methyltransferase COMT-type, S-adenosyl-L-methionine-dependent methyltransferase [Helianthus annuus]